MKDSAINYGKRVATIREKMEENELDYLLFFHPINQYYIAGTSQYQILILPLKEDPILLVKRNIDKAKKESWIKDIRQIRGTKEGLSIMARELPINGRNVGMEFNITSIFLYKLAETVLEKANFKDFGPVMLSAREIKDKEEIESIKKAAKISDLILEKIFTDLREGITEIELAAEADYQARKNYNEGDTFFYSLRGHSIYWRMGAKVISGPETAIPSDYGIIGGKGLSKAISHGSSTRKIVRGDQVSIDLGPLVNGYHSDTSRTFFMGRPNKELEGMYAAALEAQLSLIDNAKPGKKISEMTKTAIKIIEKSGYTRHFMGAYPHNNFDIGHGVGLYINEYPFIIPSNDDILMPGMVFAVEPKIAVPNIGSVEIENTIVINEKGCEVLSKFPMAIERVIR